MNFSTAAVAIDLKTLNTTNGKPSKVRVLSFVPKGERENQWHVKKGSRRLSVW